MKEVILSCENLSKTFSNGGVQQHVLKTSGSNSTAATLP